MIPPGRDPWKFAPGLLWTLPCVPFSFADFALYPSAVTNSCVYNYTLGPVSPNEPSHWEWSWGPHLVSFAKTLISFLSAGLVVSDTDT